MLPCVRRAPLAALAVLALASGPAPTAEAAARIGAPAPRVALVDAGGETVRLADLRGRIVVVDFWASWCMPCSAIVPALDRVARRYPSSAVVVLAVGLDDDPARAD